MDFDDKREPNKNMRRKGKKPTRFKPVESTSRSVKTLETEKSKEKKISLETDSDVRQKKKNTSGEKELVIQEPVPENLPITPQFKSDQINDRQDKTESVKNPASCGFGLEDCVKILRQLEASKHIDKGFRQRFLTWYGLKAMAEETRVVRTFIHAFKDDLEALAEQLIDAFSDFISKKRSATGDGDGASSSGAFFKKPRIN